MTKLKKITYEQLNSRQQENYNFQKIAAHLADYGFNCLRLSDDWQGADFIACHKDGNTFLKVQIKGRLTIDRKYADKNIYITFRDSDVWYLYPHDKVKDKLLAEGLMAGTKSWEEKGVYHWPSLSKQILKLMEPVPRRFVWNLTCAGKRGGGNNLAVRSGQGWTKSTRRAWP